MIFSYFLLLHFHLLQKVLDAYKCLEKIRYEVIMQRTLEHEEVVT